jgi:ABC-2 type transport system permease protein
MRKLWLIAATTYKRRIRSGMFLLLTFGLPLLMVVAAGVGILTAIGSEAPAEIGIVDQTEALAPDEPLTIPAALLETDQNLLFTPFPDQEAAHAAVVAGEIGGYLLIAGDYLDGGAVTYFANEEPGAVVEAAMEIYLQRAMLGEQPEWLFSRLQNPATYTYVGLTSGEEVAEGPGLVIRIVAPAFLAIVFALAVFMGAGQMGSAIVREKESRAMEMVVTSLRPRELVGGKVLGMTLLSLTQFGIWTAGALAAVAVFAFRQDLRPETLTLPWASLLWGIALIVPAYFLYAMLAAGLGIIAGDNQQAQQLAGVLGVVGLAPLWVLAPIVSNPGGAAAVGLTLFPLTAPTVALVRMTLSDVPMWQLVASLAILLLSLTGAVWFVTKIFRGAMLNYGQTLRPRQIWQVLTEA